MRASAIDLHDLAPSLATFRDDVLGGLARARKAIPAKWFYDERGSSIFEEICDLPEYYPTRTETGLLQARAAEIADAIGPQAALLEYGSGASRKVRILLDALQRPAAYVPIDISREFLVTAAEAVAADHPALEVIAVCADYTTRFALPRLPESTRRRVIFFPGSTIGNFTPLEAETFLANAAAVAGSGAGLLIGVDLRKDPAVIEAAYDDRQGVTAKFNLNLLARINRELDGDFDLGAFAHRALYDTDLGRIEMHLVSRRDQQVRVAGRAIAFAAGETIHTENSYKYTVEGFRKLARGVGLAPAQAWVDPAELFGIHYLNVP